MAWTPVSNTVPQYAKDASGTSASSYYIKFYDDGTTTPISMATDSTGGTTLAKCQLNSLGYPINGSGDVFIPHIDQTYKLALYTNATDADADTLANAVWVVDNINQVTTDADVLEAVAASGKYVKDFDTMAGAVADTALVVGDVLLIKDRANSHWDVVLASGVTPNTYNIVQCTGVGTLALVLRIYDDVFVDSFSAVGDGSTDDTLAIKAAADYIQASGGRKRLVFRSGAVYLISYQGSAYSSVNGNVVCSFSSVPSVSLIGNWATIKVVNHNITTYGGLRFANFSGCSDPYAEQFIFDMTFTGANTSGSFYPFCGAITYVDAATGSQSQSQLNSNVVARDMKFKLYHEKGSYMQSASAYAGDPNNGYKVYSLFAYGDYLATSYANQNRSCTFENILFQDGHNAYGTWVWSYNDVTFNNIRAESFVSKYSNSAGAVGGSGVPMIRYHQWHCSGLNIDEIHFRSKPSDERTTVGFEGAGLCMNIDTNLTGDYSHGVTNIGKVNLIFGNGDSANSLFDYGIHMFHYGITNIKEVNIDAVPLGSNATTSVGIRYAAEVNGAQGFGTLNIGAVNMSKRCDRVEGVLIDNGASSAANRRLKMLNIDNINSFGQLQHAIKIGNTSTAFGVPTVKLSNINIDGSDNSVWGPASTNSRALQLACSETTDVISINGLYVKDKYYLAQNDSVNCSVRNFTIRDLRTSGITTDYTTSSKSPVLDIAVNGTPESAVVANVGSVARRDDGGASTTFYVKESGTGNTGWIAK